MNKLVSACYCAQLAADTNRITHHGLAKIWIEVYGQNFKYTNGKWYERKNNNWIEFQHASYMTIILRSTLTYDFIKFITTLTDGITTVSDKKACAKQIIFAAYVFGKIDSDVFINGVLRECLELAYVNEDHAFCNDLISKL